MSHKREKKDGDRPFPHPGGSKPSRTESGVRALKVVVKADTRGTLEAVERALASVSQEENPIEIIERGVGEISKTDLTMALTGSRLVLGFDVGVLPKGDEFAREHGVEVRLYDLVDTLAREVGEVARSLVPAPAPEQILGHGRVVALFKSTRRGTILGCEVLGGKFAVGMPFRVIDPAGPIYQGRIESLHIEESAVQQAKPGQKVGIKISDFKQGRVGDLVECFETVKERSKPWAPRPGVARRGEG